MKPTIQNTVKGSKLSPSQQAQVLRVYVNRFTGDNHPAWAKQLRPDGSAYPVQFLNDSDWLENTLFFVTKSGELNKRHKFCHSSPTWPFNP
jgi:hypothetical protein